MAISNLKMKLKKRGMFFTFAGILLIILITTLQLGVLHLEHQSEQLVISHRLHSMNQFVENLRVDAQRALYTSSFRALLVLTEQVAMTGQYITNPQLDVEQLIMTGAIDGVEKSLMENNTMPYWIAKLQQQADMTGMIISMTPGAVLLEHVDPWHIQVTVPMDVIISDKRGLAQWEYSFSAVSSIPIDGFDDPIYIVETSGLMIRTIQQSPVDGHFVYAGNTDNLTMHIEQGWYIAFDDAPSYLMRLQGIGGSDPHGIESIVDKIALSLIMPVTTDANSVDHRYFWSHSAPLYQFSGIDPSVWLDNLTGGGLHRIERYNLTNQVIS